MPISYRSARRGAVAALAAAVLAAGAAAQERDRRKIPEKYKWNLADIYPDAGAWRAAKERLASEPPKIRAFQGKLASSPGVLADALELRTRLWKEFVRLADYAGMLADQDTRDAGPQGMRQEMQELRASMEAAGAYVQPEILKAGAATIDRFLASEPRLKVVGRRNAAGGPSCASNSRRAKTATNASLRTMRRRSGSSNGDGRFPCSIESWRNCAASSCITAARNISSD